MEPVLLRQQPVKATPTPFFHLDRLWATPATRKLLRSGRGLRTIAVALEELEMQFLTTVYVKLRESWQEAHQQPNDDRVCAHSGGGRGRCICDLRGHGPGHHQAGDHHRSRLGERELIVTRSYFAVGRASLGAVAPTEADRFGIRNSSRRHRGRALCAVAPGRAG